MGIACPFWGGLMWASNELTFIKCLTQYLARVSALEQSGHSFPSACLCCFPFYTLTVNHTLYIVLGWGDGRVEVKYCVHELCSRICGGDCYTSQDWACIVNLAMCCVLLTLKVPWRPCVAWIADIGMIRIVQLSTKQLAHFTWFCTDSEHHTHSIWFVLGKGANVWKQNPPAKSAHFKAPVRVVHKWPVLA